MTGLESLYLHSKGVKGINNIFKLGGNTLKKLLQLYKDVKKAEDFNHFYRTLDIQKIIPTSNLNYSTEFVKFALNFPASLALFYMSKEVFNQIRVPGDDSNVFSALNMKDYFIQLSWLKDVDVNNRETLVKLETDIPTKKIGINEIDFNFLSTNYTSEIIVNNFSKLVILGNPGVGKSTFVKWICNQWALSAIQLDKIPVFIELKHLNFQSHDNIFFNYINKFYIDDQHKNIKEYIQEFGKRIVFLFDGYDEISSENQKKFKADIEQLELINSNLNYILLGRPYAFFKYVFYKEEVLQIDGFNEASIHNYIKAFLSRNPHPQKSEDEILNKIINKNDILIDYAHNPLILSYIVLIYISENNPKEILLNIRSKYQLYERVHQWMLDYALRHKKVLDNTIEHTYELAEYCCLNKQFIYQSNKMSDPFFEYANLLSKVGFGSIYASGKGTKWRYSFASVTIQEFFAAEKLSNTITANQFLYLSQDTFFWNINTLIMGALIQNKEHSIVYEIFTGLEENRYDFEQTKYQYFKYTLLAECDTQVINNIISNKHIEELFSFFKSSYFDKNYKQLLLDSIRKIYPKLYLEKQHILQAALQAELHSLLLVDNQKREGNITTYILWELSVVTKITHDEAFIALVFEVLEKLMQRLIGIIERSKSYNVDNTDHAWKISDIIDKEYEETNQAIFFLLYLVNQSPNYILENHTECLKRYYDISPIDLKNDFTYLQLKTQTLEEIVEEIKSYNTQVKTLINPYYEDIHSYPERLPIELPDNNPVVNYPNQIINLVYSLIKYFEKNSRINSEHTQLIQDSLENFDRVFLSPEYEDEGKIIEQITDDLLVALAKVKKDAHVLDYIYYYKFRADIESALYPYTDKDVFNKKIIELKKKSEKLEEIDINDINFLTFLIKHTELGRFSFGNNKDIYKQIIRAFTHQNAEDLSSEDYEENEVALVLYELFESAYFDFDRKVLIDIAFEYQDWPFFKKYVLPNLLEKQMVLYEQKYIDFLSHYTPNTGDVFQLIYYLENEGLYKYESNIPFLRRSLEFIYSEILNNNSVLRDHTYSLLSICSRFLILIMRSETHMLEDYIYLCSKFLEKKELKQIYTQDVYLETLKADNLLAYIVLYHFIRKDKYINTFNYKHFKQEQKVEAKRLLQILALLFVPNYEVDEFYNNIHLQKVMGEDLFKDFSDYVLNFHMKVNNFNYKKFKSIGDS